VGDWKTTTAGRHLVIQAVSIQINPNIQI